MKKSLIFKILYLFLGLVVMAGASVFATNTFLANQVTYGNTNVETALNNLFIQNNKQNYSTDEQVIGKWINNKPIYRKVVSLGNFSANTKENYISTGISNVDHIVDFNIRFKFDDGNEFDNLYLLKYSLGYITPYIDNASKKIYVAHFCSANLNSVYSIIEYTKTTD